MLDHAHTPRRRLAAAFVVFSALVAGYAIPSAQQAPGKKVLGIEDYTKWRTITSQEISGDGNWVAYGQSQANTVPAEAKPVLHIVRVETNQHTEVANATGPIFSADSKWSGQLTYTLGRAEEIGGDLFSLDYVNVTDYPRHPTAAGTYGQQQGT